MLAYDNLLHCISMKTVNKFKIFGPQKLRLYNNWFLTLKKCYWVIYLKKKEKSNLILQLNNFVQVPIKIINNDQNYCIRNVSIAPLSFSTANRCL